MKPVKYGVKQVLHETAAQPAKWIAFASYKDGYDIHDDMNHPLRICKTEHEAEAELRKILEEREPL